MASYTENSSFRDRMFHSRSATFLASSKVTEVVTRTRAARSPYRTWTQSVPVAPHLHPYPVPPPSAAVAVAVVVVVDGPDRQAPKQGTGTQPAPDGDDVEPGTGQRSCCCVGR